MLFFIFFPTFDLADSIATLSSAAPVRRQDAVVVGGSTLLALTVVFITSVAMVAAWPKHTQSWANILGAIAGALSAVQYIPQLYYTYTIRDVKSLSLTTMVMQTPGAFLFAFSLYLRVGPEGWSTWLVYIITGLLQGALFGMGVYFQLEQRRDLLKSTDAAETDEGVTDVEGALANGGRATERTALLAGSQDRESQQTDPPSTNRQFNMLYSATPPDEDSDTEGEARHRTIRKKHDKKR